MNFEEIDAIIPGSIYRGEQGGVHKIAVNGDLAFDADRLLCAHLDKEGWKMVTGHEGTEVSRPLRRAWHHVTTVFKKGRKRLRVDIVTHGREINPALYS